MRNIFRSNKQKIEAQKETVEMPVPVNHSSTEEGAVEGIDYMGLLQDLHTKRLETVTMSEELREAPIGELKVAVEAILIHAQKVAVSLGWSLRECSHIGSVTYGTAVTRMLANILNDAPSMLVNKEGQSATNEDKVHLAEYLSSYYSFMGVLYDHLGDAEIDGRVKDEIQKYYATYVTTTFTV